MATSERVVALVTKYSIEQELTTRLSDSFVLSVRIHQASTDCARASQQAQLSHVCEALPTACEAGVAEAPARALSTVEMHPSARLRPTSRRCRRNPTAGLCRGTAAPAPRSAVTDALSSRLSGSDQSEGGQRLEQAAKSALATLRGELDIVISNDCINAGGVAPEKAPRYNVFISHKRSDAQDFARGLCTRGLRTRCCAIGCRTAHICSWVPPLAGTHCWPSQASRASSSQPQPITCEIP